jgi:alginate O-acetyltransferase complex protein AlgI
MSVLDTVWLAWIAGFVLCAWVTPPAWRPLAMAGITLVFVSRYDPPSAFILVIMALATVGVGRSTRTSSTAIGVSIVLLLGALAVFKLRASDANAAIPLGMSYYTFRCVHYLLERFKRRLPPHTLAEFLGYIFFLPTLLAGPIHRFGPFHGDLHRPRPLVPRVAEGLERILYGYAKVVLLANVLVSDRLRGLAESVAASSPRLGAYLDMLAGGLNGYLQFAGYSDIAIGVALLAGFKVMENFNNPFGARNIVEFWQRWHISLTSWVREYLYTSVFSFTRRPYVAAIVTMLAIGLWHEISWRYVVWGLAHGAAVVLCQWYQRRRPAPQRGGPRAALAWLVTVHFVMLSFVLVQHDFAGAFALYRQMLLGGQ